MTTTNSGIVASARGIVSGHWVHSKTGATRPFAPRHNQMSYMAADAVAAAYGGDTAFVPKFIGFIYGTEQVPAGLADPTDREMTWKKLKAEMRDIGGNVLVSRFSTPPTLSVNCQDDPTRYEGNAVTFHACTRSGSAGEYAFDPSGEGDFAGKFDDGMILYHALLLGLRPGQECSTEKEYIILARTSLDKGGKFRKKPEDYELALDWRVSFF